MTAQCWQSAPQLEREMEHFFLAELRPRLIRYFIAGTALHGHRRRDGASRGFFFPIVDALAITIVFAA
jgi:hypothetical protein